jgi:hypothetical protein
VTVPRVVVEVARRIKDYPVTVLHNHRSRSSSNTQMRILVQAVEIQTYSEWLSSLIYRSQSFLPSFLASTGPLVKADGGVHVCCLLSSS